MIYHSYVFLMFFLPLLLLLNYMAFRNNIRRQNMLLLMASLFFYSWGEPRNVFIMLLCIGINWSYGYLCLTLDSQADRQTAFGGMNPAKLRKAAFVMTIIMDLGLLAFYKYTAFAISNMNRLLSADFSIPSLVLPAGISFFTFQALSYTIDVYRRTVPPQRKFSQIVLYISLFPQLMEGPIIRYGTIADELEDRRFNGDDFSSGISRFITGLGKKVLIANVMAQAADFAFDKAPGSLSVSAAWIGAAAYGLQIYFDFSGYSDMAIGLGKLFGFHFPENFNYPYMARSISEFWRRWHISLTTWFRDYVYIPMGGSRVNSKKRLILNLFAVWALTGLWHGASWTFVGWGMLFFILITLEKITGFGKWIARLPVISNLYMLTGVLLGWVLFRSSGEQHAIKYFMAMFGLNGNPLIGTDTYWLTAEYAFTWIIGVIGCLPIVKALNTKRFAGHVGITFVRWMILALITLLSIAAISGSDYNPFIYSNF